VEESKAPQVKTDVCATQAGPFQSFTSGPPSTRVRSRTLRAGHPPEETGAAIAAIDPASHRDGDSGEGEVEPNRERW
jgi:hypothetical protein